MVRGSCSPPGSCRLSSSVPLMRFPGVMSYRHAALSAVLVALVRLAGAEARIPPQPSEQRFLLGDLFDVPEGVSSGGV